MIPDALVIGAGPAGLMAAGELARAGHSTLLAEVMPTPARKFLMAGKSGLNLTRNQPPAEFATNFTAGTGAQGFDPVDLLTDFGPAQIMSWAEGLGIPLFTGSTLRVFPAGMKASPLLRAWLARLRGLGIDLRTGWRWTGLTDGAFVFETPDGPGTVRPRVAVLALGGASWPRLGSDAAWVPILRGHGVRVAEFQPANMGFRVDWSPAMARFLGTPVKGCAIRAGDQISRGEWVISARGIEGGGIYQIAAVIRDGAAARLDLMPDLAARALTDRLAKPRGKLSVGNWLRRVLGDPLRAGLLLEWGQPLPKKPADLARLIKDLPMRLAGPLGLERAISAAGGISWSGLDAGLQLRALPGVFAAGEMLDWEAPTGGYLLSGCLSTGQIAGRAAARRLMS